VKQYGLSGDDRIALYLPQTQSPARSVYVTLRATGDPTQLLPAARRAVADFDADLPIYRVKTMERRVDESLARARFTMTLLTAFAVVALILAAIGTYGVMAYLVKQSTRELGIRMALGATTGAVLGLVMRKGVVVASLGLVAGVAGAFALTRSIRTMLFGIAPTDAPTFIAVVIILGMVAVVATLGPARRAARVDPTITMRAE
jgi:ABC-type antimicrobial peptide transport system permease subunit